MRESLKLVSLLQTIDLPDKTFDSYDVAGLGNYGTYGVTIHSYVTGANLTDYTINCLTDEDSKKNDIHTHTSTIYIQNS